MSHFDLKKEFDEWYHGLENFCTRSERAAIELSDDYKIVQQWLYAAFSMGAKAAYTECNESLLEFGTHLAGIEAPKGFTYTEGYDNAAYNISDRFRKAIEEWRL